VKSYALGHLPDAVLLRDTASLVTRDRATLAELLAHIAEVDTRKLYLPAAYDSMLAWCMGELRFSEHAALGRLHAARAAREFPPLFVAVADGRLDLTGVRLLAPHMTRENAEEVIASAANKGTQELRKLLAERFPKPDLQARIEPQVPANTESLLVSKRVDPASSPVEAGAAPARSSVSPRSSGRFALQATVSEATHDKLRYAQDLLGHQVLDGDIATVLDRALDALIAELERSRFRITERPRRCGSTPAPGSRYIPADVKRAVVRRDQCRCTYVSDSGRRCEARKRLEFDHEVPVARGGESTVANVRLRCRAHNQYEAERTYGVEFMRRKREESAERCQRTKARAAVARARAVAVPNPGTDLEEDDAFRCLLALGYRPTEARWALARCGEMPGATDEERVKRALAQFPQRVTRVDRSGWVMAEQAEAPTTPMSAR
jgi:5-methylcytosine-specific restriction endonuclease McrA